MTKIDQFLHRLPKNAPQESIAHIATAFEIANKAAAQISAIRADMNLSRAGQAVAIEKALTGGMLGHLAQIRADVDKRLSDAVGQRSVLRDRVLKAENFPSHLKAEVRQWLRELDHVERIKQLGSDDPLIKESVLGAPSYLSGIPADVWNRAADAEVAAQFGEHLDAIDTLEATYETARAAVQVAVDDVRRCTEFDAAEFARLAA